MRLIDQVCELVTETHSGSLNAATAQQARRCVLNHLGLVLAGSASPAVRSMVAVMAGLGPGLAPSAARGGTIVTPLDVASIYAAAANVYDYDETHISTVMHATSVVIPAVLGLATRRPLTGSAFLEAIVIGVQVAICVGEQVSPHHYAQGWHITSTCGIFGAAAAVAHVLGMDAAGVRNAMGNAFVLSSGSVEALGTGSKCLGVGGAAANGLRAVLSAEAGIGGPTDPFEGKFGFVNLYGQGRRTAGDCSGAQRWLIHDVLLKPYPCGVVLNPVVEAALGLRTSLLEGGRKLTDIEGLLIRGNPLLRMRTDRPDVATLEMRQVSSQYVVPTALMEGCVGLAQMRSEKPAQALRAQLAKMIRFQDVAGESLEAAELAASLRGGETVTVRVDEAVGGSAKPLNDEAVARKVHDLCRFAGRESLADWLIAQVQSLEGRSDMNELITRLNPVVFGSGAGAVPGGR